MNVTKRKYDILVLLGLIGIDFYYLYKAFFSKKYKMVFIGPYEFPKIIGLLFAVICVYILAKTILQTNSRNEKMGFKNIKIVIVTMVTLLIFLLLWQHFGLFYLWGYSFLLFLLFFYNDEGKRFKKSNILSNLTIATIVIIISYLSFNLLMGIRL